jgi:hypothetical protein
MTKHQQPSSAGQAGKKSSLGLLLGILGAGVVLAIVFALVASGGKRQRIASADELALIAPLAPGSALESYSIETVHPVEHGVLRVVCVKGKSRVQLDIALRGPGPLPTADNGRYVVFYSLENAPESDGQLLAKALASRLHIERDPPTGMTVFVPQNPDLAK